MKKTSIPAVVLALLLSGPLVAGETIRVLMSTHPLTDAIYKLLPDFEKETGIKVNYDIFGDEQGSQKMSVEFVAGNSTIDVFMFRPLQDMRVFYRNGWFEDLVPYYKDDQEYDFADFNPAATNATSINGMQCCIPISIETETLFYRTDLFEAKGLKPPTTFEEFEAAAEKLTDRDNDRFGWVSRDSKSGLITMFSSFLYGFGGDWVDKAGNSAIDTPEFIEAAGLYSRLLRKYGPPGSPNVASVQALAIFSQGKAAMITEGSTHFASLLDPARSSVADKTSVALFPAGPKAHKVFYVIPWGFGISKQSTNKQAAWRFIRYMTDKKRTMIIQGEMANPQARMSTYQTPEGVKSFSSAFAKVLEDSGKISVAHDRPQVTAVQEARDIIGEPVVAGIEGRDIRPHAKASSQKFQEIIDREKAEK